MTDPIQIQRDYRSVKLDRRIRWRERHDVRERGINHPTFTDREVWAKRYEAESAYGVEGHDLVRTNRERTYLLRFDERLKPNDLLVDGGTQFVIVSVMEPDRRRWCVVRARIVE